MDPTKPGPSGDDLPRCEICRPSFRRCCLCGQPGTLRSHSEHQICTGCLNSFSKFLHKELAGAMYPVDACKRLSCSAQKKHWVKATIDKRDNCVAHLLFFGKKLGMAAETIRRRKLTERAQARRRTKQACQSLQEVVSSQRTVFPEVDPLAPGPSCRSPPRTAQAARHVPAPAVRPTPEISRKATKNGQPQKEIEHIDLEAGLPAPPSRLPSRPPDSSSRPSTRPPEPALRPIQKGQATRKEVQQRVEPISDDAYQSDSRKQAVRFVTIGTTVKTVHRENPPAAVKMGHLNTKNATFPEREPSGNHKHRSRTHENQRDAGDSRQPPAGPLVEEPSSQPEPSAQLNQPREAVDQQPSDVVVSTSNPTNAEEAAQETSAHPPQLVEPVLSNCDPQSTTPPPMLSCPSRLSVVSTRQEPVRQPLDFILPRLISSTIQRPQEVPAPVNDVVVRRVDEPLSDQEEERRQESTEREVDVRENQKDGLEDVCSPGRSIGLFDFEGYEEPSPSVSVTEGGSPSSNGSSPRREKGNEDQEGEAPLDVLHRDALKLKATVARMRPPFWAVFERARERAEAEIAEQLRELEKAKEARVENGQPDVDNRNGDTSTSDSSCAGTPKDPEERKKREAEKEHLQQVALEANVSATVRQFLESGQLENIQLEADKTRKEDSSHVTEVDQNEPGPSGQDDVQSGTDNNEDFENLDLDHDYFARLPELRKRNRISGQDERQLTQDYCTQQTVENGAQESEMTGEVQEEQAAEEVPRMDKWQQENEKMTESGPVLENIDEGRRQKPMEPRVEDINSEQNQSNGHPEVERTSQEDSSREQQPDGDDDDELEEIIDEEYDYDLQAAYLKVRRETSEEEESPLTSPNTSALTEVDEGEAEEAGPKGGRQLATAPDDDDDDEDSSDSSSDSSSSSDDSETTDYMEDWEGPEDSGSAVSSSAQNGREMSAPSIGKEPMVEVMVDVADGNDGSVEELDPIQEGLPVADEEDELMSPRSPSEYCPSEHCMYSPIATGSPIYSEGIYIPPGQEPLEITGEEGGEVVESGRCSPSPAWRSPTYHAWRGAPPAWRSPLFPAVQQQARCPASPVERRSLSPLVAPQLVSTCSQSKSSPRRIRRCSISAVWRAPSSSVIAFDLPTQEMLVSLSQNELERRYEFLRPGPSRQSTAPSWTIQTSRRSFRHHRDDQDEGFQWAVAQDIETNGAGRREDVEPVQRPNSFDYLLSKAENLLREEDVKPIDEREKWLTFMQTEVQPASPDSDIEILEPSPIIQEVDFSSLVDPLPDQAESTDVAAEEIDQSDGEQVRDLQDSLVEENLDRIYPEEVESCQKPEENATISQSPGKQRPPVDSLFVADPFLEPEKSINEDTLLKTGECQSGGKGILKVDEYRLWDLSTKRDLWAQLEEVAKFQRSKRESGKSVQAEPPSRRPAVCRRTISRAHNIRRERWRAPGAPSDDSGQLEQQAPKRGRPRKERQEVSTKGRPRKMSHSHQKRPRNEQTEVEEEGINPLECTENEQVLVDPYGDEQQEENSRRPTEAVNDQEAGDEIIVEATREDVQLDIQQETEDICQDQQIYIENGRHLANGERDQPKQKSPRKRTAKCDGDQQHPKRRSVKTRRMPLDGEKSGKMALVEDTEDDDEIEILEESSGETDDCQNISCSSSDVQMEGEDSDMENDQGDTISANREKRQNETVDLAQDSSRKRPAVEEDQLPSKRARRATRQRIEKGGNSKGTQSRQQRNKEGRHGDGQTSQKSDEKVQYIMKTDESYPCLGQQKPKPDEKNSHQPRPATISSKKSYNPLENKCTRCWRLPKQQGKEICLYCAYEKCLTCLHKICNCTSRESVPT